MNENYMNGLRVEVQNELDSRSARCRKLPSLKRGMRLALRHYQLLNGVLCGRLERRADAAIAGNYFV